MPFSRRDFLATTAAALAAGVPRRTLAQPSAAAPPVTKFRELRGGVGVFTAMGGTIGYLVNSAGAVAIDTQYANTAPIALAGLKERAPKGVAMLINTHHHGDHTGGNQVFRSSVKQIVAHVNCVEWHRKSAAAAKTEADQSFADTTFTDQWRADFGGEAIQARYYGPGHTGGDAVIHLEKANVVHMGDLLFNRAHPNIDRPSGAHIGNWIVVLEKVASAHSNEAIFIAGHGKENQVDVGKQDVLRFRDYLSACLDTTRKAIASGEPKEALQKIAALPGFDDNISLNDRLTLGFVLGQCYDELTEKK